MAVVDNVLVQSGPVDPGTARREFSRKVWEWYRQHQNDTIYTAFGFFKVKVSHVRKVFEQIAGYERDV